MASKFQTGSAVATGPALLISDSHIAVILRQLYVQPYPGTVPYVRVLACAVPRYPGDSSYLAKFRYIRGRRGSPRGTWAGIDLPVRGSQPRRVRRSYPGLGNDQPCHPRRRSAGSAASLRPVHLERPRMPGDAAGYAWKATKMAGKGVVKAGKAANSALDAAGEKAQDAKLKAELAKESHQMDGHRVSAHCVVPDVLQNRDTRTIRKRRGVGVPVLNSGHRRSGAPPPPPPHSARGTAGCRATRCSRRRTSGTRWSRRAVPVLPTTAWTQSRPALRRGKRARVAGPRLQAR
eukprot:SAG31_NODE_2440_length_5690_cov_23.385262_7_plen_291_part_00